MSFKNIGKQMIKKYTLAQKPKHLIKLSRDHTKNIRKILDSFEGAIWLAFLRGKATQRTEFRNELNKIKKTIEKSKDKKIANKILKILEKKC